MNSNQISQVSQSTLNLWQTCPRKFQHQVLDNLHLPSGSNTQMEQGSRFHLLMQQRELGLDISDLAASDPQLQNWIGTYETNPPLMILGNRYPEYTLTYKLQPYNFIITAIYDLLILGTNQAQILDWKTHNQPLSASVLQSHWQTRLYLYLLAATTNYLPEQLTFSYWFANTGTTVAIAYSNQNHDQTEQELSQILSSMAESEQASYFPQIPQGNEKCHKCEFKYRCDRTNQSLNLGAVSKFPEVPI